jgi:hypothetical protein
MIGWEAGIRTPIGRSRVLQRPTETIRINHLAWQLRAKSGKIRNSPQYIEHIERGNRVALFQRRTKQLSPPRSLSMPKHVYPDEAISQIPSSR